MTDILRSAVIGTGRRIALAYRLGGRTMWLAPLLVAPAVLAELAQHVAEIHLGMFASLAAFRGLQMDPTRWAFGYFKVAGFMLTTILVARYWAVDGVMARIPRIGRTAALRLGLGLIASFAFAGIDHWIGRAGAPVAIVSGVVDLIISAALSTYMVGALLGEERADLRWSFVHGWPRSLMMTLTMAAAFIPCQLLHLFDHRVAIGSALPVVVIMMTWDAVFVGLFAALVGAASFVGFHYGPDWRGWTREP